MPKPVTTPTGTSSSPPADRPTDRLRVSTAALTWIGIFLGSGVIGGVVLSRYSGLTAENRPATYYLLAPLVLWFASAIGVALALRADGTPAPRRALGLSVRPIDCLGLVVGAAIQFGVLELVYWPLRAAWPATFGRADVERPAQQLIDSAHGAWVVVLFLVVVVGAPLAEEIVYRGMVQRALLGRLAAPAALAITACWFALAHFQAVQLPGLLVIGAVLGIAAWKTDRLGFGIMTHAGFNAASFLVLWAKR